MLTHKSSSKPCFSAAVIGKIFLSLLGMFLIASLSHASFQKELWPYWVVTNPLAHEVITHEEWGDFLRHNLKINAEGIALIDYQHIKDEDKKLLNAYIQRLSMIPVEKYNRREQLAYWLNLYNALTVQIIIKHYPISSIQDIKVSPGLFSIGPWGAKIVKVNRHFLSLDDIENRIIRPVWNDNRVLYALNNGSIGAPNLHSEPFNAERLDEQLHESASTYINSLRGVQIVENNLIVSKIYDWFEEDFGGSEKMVILHLMQFAKEPLKSRLKNMHEIERYVYNWHLNTQVSS